MAVPQDAEGAYNSPAPGDPVLVTALVGVAEDDGEWGAWALVRRLGEEAREPLLARLEAAAILRRQDDTVGWLRPRPRRRWPVLDSRRKDDLRRQLEDLMVHPLDPDPRTAGLAVLLNAIHAGPQIDLTGIPHRQISSHIKEIEASVDDAWYPAEVRSWSPSRSGWWANCSRYRGIGETELGTFHEDDVRPDTVDRSYGRES